MGRPFRVVVFGKAECDKCAVLQKRLGILLAAPEWGDFEQAYLDVETEEGLVAFCRIEGLNPQRIPALVVMQQDAPDEPYRAVPAVRAGRDDPARRIRLRHVLGLQTDYSETGRGVVTPKMVAAVLADARRVPISVAAG